MHAKAGVVVEGMTANACRKRQLEPESYTQKPTNRDFFPSNVFYLCVLFKKWMSNNFSVEGEAVLVKVRNV